MVQKVAKLYIDTGVGFNEEQVISHTITGEKAVFDFDLISFDTIKSLRFDPASDFSVIHVNDIKIIREDDSSYSIGNYQSNALLRSNNKLMFATENPQLYFYIFGQKARRVIIKLKYLIVGNNAFSYILDSIVTNINNSTDDALIKQKQEMNDLAKKIASDEAYIHRFETHINELSIQLEAIKDTQSKLLNLGSWQTQTRMQLRQLFKKATAFRHRFMAFINFYNREFRTIGKSGLFNRAYYTEHCEENQKYIYNPLLHFIRIGTPQGKNPNPLFDLSFYIDQNPDLRKSGMNPLFHYITIGAGQGKDPSPLFDSSYYIDQNPDVLESGMNPLAHYIEIGALENKDPHPLFDSFYYLEKNPDALESGINPLFHYIQFGAKEGQSPHPLFDPAYYLENNPDVVESGMNPFLHYISSGAVEGRNPNPAFDALYYLKQNPDIVESGMNPLTHYICIGSKEGRNTNLITEIFQCKPVISIITPVHNVEEKYLNNCIRSVLNQIYNKWELCLIDDGSNKSDMKPVLERWAEKDQRIKVKYLSENKSVSAVCNEGLSFATGEFICFLDSDDVLTTDAIFEVVKAINNSRADLIYSDEALIDENGRYLTGIHKPDFSPDLLLSHNYISHLLIGRKALFHEAGGFSSKYDGVQDYDFCLKATEKTEKICHIPKILYYWRNLPTATSSKAKSSADIAGKKALEEALNRRKIKGEVLSTDKLSFYHIKRKLDANPLISIIIPFRDESAYLIRCIEAILDKTSYDNIEIVGINNNSTLDETVKAMRKYSESYGKIKFIDYNLPFNYSKICNYAVCLSNGEHIVLMNNDIEIITPDWIEALLEHSQREDVGAVGAKLYYADNTIQHAGVTIGISGFAGHSHRHFKRNESGYAKRLMCIQNVSAVSGALMMVKKSLYEEIGGFEEENLGVALNDIDFCLNLRKRRYLNIFTPYCEAYHYESVSRGYEDTPVKESRLRREVRYFQEKWKDILDEGDPYYNINLTVEKEDFSLK